MKKNGILWIILDFIFLVVFNILFFTFLGASGNPASVWISYAFIHLSYLMLLATPFLTTKGKSQAVFGYSLSAVAGIYFLAELVVGVVFILIRMKSWKPAFTVQLVLLAIYGGALLVQLLANEKTAANEAKIQKGRDFLLAASNRMSGIMQHVQDKKLKKKMEKAYDALKSCQVKSNPAVAELEAGIMHQLDLIEQDIFGKAFDDAEKDLNILLKMISERERQLRRKN